MDGRIEPRTFVVWLISALVVVIVVDHPVVDVVVVAVAGLVASTEGRTSSFRTFLLLGLGLTIVRTVLFALTGHSGDHILVTLPALDLPTFLGGTTIGGAVTAEVVASGLVESLRILAVLASFGAFLSATTTIEVVRLLPRFAFEAGLVTNIAMAFVPQMARCARDLRETQALRGARRWSIAGTVSPLLASALDRSTRLAESMDSRGFGREDGDGSSPLWRASASVGALIVISIASVWATRGGGPLASLVLFVSLVGFGVLLSRLSRSRSRPRYRRARWNRSSLAVAAVAVSAAGLSIVMTLFGTPATRGFDVYTSPALRAPPALTIVAALALAAPALPALRKVLR